MSARYLFGPVSGAYADENLREFRDSGACRCFGSGPGVDHVVGPDDGWQAVLDQLPTDWRPDFVVLQLQYTTIPAAFQLAPIPVVGLAGDWVWLWHGYRRFIPRSCDLVLTDPAGVEVLRKFGYPHAWAANLFGAARTLLAAESVTTERDVDALFIGNMHPHLQRERLPYVARLAGLRPRWNVVMRSGVFGEEYRRLLGRARIVFNRASRGEFNMRVGEALAAGALLFQEAGNREVAQWLRPGEEYVEYDDDNLEALLERYLEDEPERVRIAEAARRRLPELTFARFWSEQVERIAAALPELRERAADRCGRPVEHDLVGEVWQQLSSQTGIDAGLKTAVAAQANERPRDAALHNLRGVLALTETPQRRTELMHAANAFQDAWRADPRHVVAGLNLVETLVALGQRTHAAEEARRVLAATDTLTASGGACPRRVDRRDKPGGSPALDDPLRPHGFDLMRVEWERAAWEHAGDPRGEARAKLDLVRWRRHMLLGELAGDGAKNGVVPSQSPFFTSALTHFFSACLLGGDLPASRVALGLALANQGRLVEAVPHLEAALAGNPFDGVSARVLHSVLGRLGRTGSQMALARRRRRLAEAAPGLVPVEERYAEGSLAGTGGLGGTDGLGGTPGVFDGRVSTSTPVEDSGRATQDHAATASLRIVWQGEQEKVHSLALVNRNLCAALAARGHELSLVPASGVQAPGATVTLPAELAECVGKTLSGPADVHVTHQWPPDFTRPGDGRWVVVQPWEFGSIPRDWLGPLRDEVDEVWVPSRFVRDTFVRDGVPAEKVHVVPNGVAEVFFRDGEGDGIVGWVESSEPTAGAKARWVESSEPTAGAKVGWVESSEPTRKTGGFRRLHPAYALSTHKRFKFLFVGGTVHRKGFDLLLKAYRQVFCDRDDVCLIVKDMGVGTFYQGQTAQRQIEEGRRQRHAPETEYLTETLTDEQMAALYRACDAVVLPYRGEGFCLPAAEAMASGCAVIVTGFGPVLDYATDETAYLLPYRIDYFREKRVDRWATVNTPFLVEPDTDALRTLLRHVVDHPEEARERGRRAREYIRERLTWGHAAAVAEARLHALAAAPRSPRSQTPFGNALRETPFREQGPALDETHSARDETRNGVSRSRFPNGVWERGGGERPPGYRPLLSVTMIVKNEAHNLPACIGSFRDVADDVEIVVGDTGSTDDTVAVARQLGARVHHFAWIDPFGAARTEALRQATGEWVFWMDGTVPFGSRAFPPFRVGWRSLAFLAEVPSSPPSRPSLNARADPHSLGLSKRIPVLPQFVMDGRRAVGYDPLAAISGSKPRDER